jgi:hypothetical protein
MKNGMKSIGALLMILLMSSLLRFLAGNPAVLEVVKKVCSVTWNS